MEVEEGRELVAVGGAGELGRELVVFEEDLRSLVFEGEALEGKLAIVAVGGF